MERRGQSVTANIWTARIIPVLLAGVVGYATYVLVVPLCGMQSIPRIFNSCPNAS